MNPIDTSILPMAGTANDVRHLIIVLGDQLDDQSTAFHGLDSERDMVWMAEVSEESTHIWSSKQRIAIFLSAMRHFAANLQSRGIPHHYTRLDAANHKTTLRGELAKAIDAFRPGRLVLTAPGDWRVLQEIRSVAVQHDLALDLRDDSHFYSTVREFSAHAKKHKPLRMEYWYRALRRKHRILMNGDEPIDGRWNFDADNRKSFGKTGPQNLPEPRRFEPDEITREVMALVDSRFADHPGRLESFAWPVTREQALTSLHGFIEHRLPLFGMYEDAMWSGEAWLYHSHLSSSLNLKLLNPREVVQAAEQAYEQGKAPLAATEGFIRQILGWREYVRGIYWTQMPGYIDLNALDARQELPAWYWTGDVEMNCLKEVITQTLDLGYAHHIQRLMVTGLYAMLLGVAPRAVHEWYLSVYVDAVEWVELPNTLGMSQYGDGGLLGSKPYAASGAYIDRMSNYCKGCKYAPSVSVGDNACPFTTLYWDFLMRHEEMLSGNPRMTMQLKNLNRIDGETRAAIRAQAHAHRRACRD